MTGNTGTMEQASTADSDVASGRLRIKALGALLWRTWPYLKPQLPHLIVWIGLTFLIEMLFVSASLVAFDLFNNKILVGEKLEPVQARLLRLDDSHVADKSTAENAEDAISGQRADGESNGEEALDPGEMLTPEQRRAVRNRLMVLFAIGALLLLSLNPVVDYYGTWILQRINQYLRVTMIERAEHLSLRYHSHARTGDAIYRVYQDSAMITNVVKQALLQPVMASGFLVFSFLVVFLFSPVLGVMFLVGLLPILWLIIWFTPRLQWRSRQARATNSDLTSRIQEAFAAIRIVKANRAERIMSERFDHDSHAALDAAFYLRVELLLMRAGTSAMSMILLMFAHYLMAGWTVADEPTFLAGAFVLVGFAAWNLGAFQAGTFRAEEITANGWWLTTLWGTVQDMAVGLNRAFFLLDLEPDVVDRENALPMPTPIQSIRYHKVAFGYDTCKPVLKGVDLSARVGTITAIVGATGSGKSTLMALLLRLYDPDSGFITINDTNLRDIRVDDLRGNTAIALQQNVLFATTVAENIAYAMHRVSPQAIEAAARVACADEFIGEMANGYSTELGERGGKLSTGQRQRITIARAIIRDTPILILDEPTASLDAETEHRVLANLAVWGRERIIFLITHRLSTIRNADQIAFLENGTISELGDHDTLMSKPDGRYRGFVETEVKGADSAQELGT